MSLTSALLYFVAVLMILYSSLILLYRRLWSRLLPLRLPEKTPGHRLRFTIVIPARNEQDNIASCLTSIIEGDYPQGLFDIIVVDDFSTDHTGVVLRQLQRQYPGKIKIIELAAILDQQPINSYKKKALELAIEQATGDWILTTDADCLVPTRWLSYFEGYILQTRKRFIAAPVRFVDTGSFVSKFQCLDFLSLQGVTAAAVAGGLMSMCNGANLCYEKAFLKEVGGFRGIDQLASGDDMFLMQKMQQREPGSTGYLFAKEVIVSTLPMPDWRAFFNQRIRWASKAGTYKDWKIKAVLLIVYLFNLGLLLLIVTGVLRPILWLCWLGFILWKFMIEYLFMRPVARFFNQQYLLPWFLLMQPLHLVYTVVAGWLGLFGKYKWKDRSVR